MSLADTSDKVKHILTYLDNLGYKYEYYPPQEDDTFDASLTMNIRGDHPTVQWIDLEITVESYNTIKYSAEIGSKQQAPHTMTETNKTLEDLDTMLQTSITPGDTIRPDQE